MTTSDRDYRLECSRRDCPTRFTGDDLASIAKRGARHLNEEHGDTFHRHEQFDTVERGGHHVHGNEWAVTRIPQYVTAFDVMERIGEVDGLLVAPDDDLTCPECLRYTPQEDRVVEESDVGISTSDEWRCAACVEEERIEQAAAANASLNEFRVGGGNGVDR